MGFMKIETIIENEATTQSIMINDNVFVFDKNFNVLGFKCMIFRKIRWQLHFIWNIGLYENWKLYYITTFDFKTSICLQVFL